MYNNKFPFGPHKIESVFSQPRCGNKNSQSRIGHLIEKTKHTKKIKGAIFNCCLTEDFLVTLNRGNENWQKNFLDLYPQWIMTSFENLRKQNCDELLLPNDANEISNILIKYRNSVSTHYVKSKYRGLKLWVT